MTSFSKYVSNAVRTAISSISPNKVVAYNQRQYDAEYSECEVLYESNSLFFFFKVANHYDMTYVPGESIDINGEGASYAFSVLNGYDPYTGMTPLRIAIAANDAKMVHCLLGLPSVSLAGVDETGDTVLHLVVKNCSGSMLSSLLDRSNGEVDINAMNTSGETALHVASRKSALDCVELLLNAGADPGIGTPELPLQLVVMNDSMECVEMIYQHSPHAINWMQEMNGSYPIHLTKSDRMFRRLCALGASLDAQDADGLTVLHTKVRENDLDAVLHLLSNGADVNLEDQNGATPLHFSIMYYASVHILRALLVFEADPSPVDSEQRSPRHLLCSDPVEYAHSKENDLSLFTLHAVGAKRCPPSMANCTIGCVNAELGRHNGLLLFDGTAPEVRHSPSDDAANLFEEIFSSVNLPRREHPPSDKPSGFRRHTRATMSTRRASRPSLPEGDSIKCRRPSPIALPNSSTDEPHKVVVKFGLSMSPKSESRRVSCQDLPTAVPTSDDADKDCHVQFLSDPEDRTTLCGSPERVAPKKRPTRPSATRMHPAKLHFVSHECTCDDSFLRDLFERNAQSSATTTDHGQTPNQTSSDISETVSSAAAAGGGDGDPLQSTHSSSSSSLADANIEIDENPEPDSTSNMDTFPTVERPTSTQNGDSTEARYANLMHTIVKRKRTNKSRWNCGPAGYRVLSLDGGGVRGLILVQILRSLERITGRRVTELFDWIIGTSTGGILSLMLLRGKCLRCCRNLLFTFKDTVFCGKRPYPAEGLENAIRQELGEHTKMTDLKQIRVAVTTLLSDRCPPLFHMFRNYTSPRIRLNDLIRQRQQATHGTSDEAHSLREGRSRVNSGYEKGTPLTSSSSVFNFLMVTSGFFSSGDSVAPDAPSENEGDYKFDPLLPDSEQFAWLAARATGAAPTYFRPCGRFLDGGLISNNPTLDLLTELQEMKLTRRLLNKPDTPLAVVVSLGTGRMPVEPIETVDVFRPQTLMETFRSAMAFSSLGRIIVEVATMSEGPVVDRASAWCASLGVPFFRFSPRISLHVALDTTNTKELLQMVWETEAYLYRARDRMEQLASMLVP